MGVGLITPTVRLVPPTVRLVPPTVRLMISRQTSKFITKSIPIIKIVIVNNEIKLQAILTQILILIRLDVGWTYYNVTDFRALRPGGSRAQRWEIRHPISSRIST